MCRRVECPTCHKPTFAGCGAHIEQVLADVPKADRCKCREASRAKEGAAPAEDSNPLRALARQLFGR